MNRFFFSPPSLLRRGFSMIELLIVISLLSVLFLLTAPALNSMLTANDLTSAAQAISDQCAFARQQALARNRSVELRFIAGGTNNFPALQLWGQVAGTNFRPLGRVITLPARAVITTANGRSPLLTDTTALTAGATNFGGTIGQANYRALTFRANGSPYATLKSGPSGNNFFTIVSLRDIANPEPPNYVTLQVTPENGRVLTFRP